MTTYLWHSAEAERVQRQRANGPGAGLHFGRGAMRNKLGFCIYLDDDGDPVRITVVSNSAKPPTAHKDLRLVGVSEAATCLVGNTGYFGDEARDWCMARDITPNLDGLLKYMGGNDGPVRTHMKKPVTVGKPIRLKK